MQLGDQKKPRDCIGMAQIAGDVLFDGAVLAKKRMCDIFSDQAAQLGCAERQKYGKCAVPNGPIEQLPGQVQELYKHASKFPYWCGYKVHQTYKQACNPDPLRRKVYGIPLCVQDRYPSNQPPRQPQQPMQQQIRQQSPRRNNRRTHRNAVRAEQKKRNTVQKGGARKTVKRS